MARVKEEVGEKVAREKIILTWRQENSFINAQKLYPLLDNRYTIQYTVLEHLINILLKIFC